MSYIDLPAAADMHVHLRQGALLQAVAPHTNRTCHVALVMPNTRPPVRGVSIANTYRNVCQRSMPDVKLLSTIKLCRETTPEIVRAAAKEGITAFKLYPSNVTTNSDDGLTAEMLSNPTTQLMDCFEVMRKAGIVLCLHGEMPGCEVMERESKFLPFLDFLCFNFPRLKIVLEHISTKEQVEHVKRLSNQSKCDVAATITAHHLWLTLDDVIGDVLRPHNFCKPVPKTKSDREALRLAATSGNPCFFLGSDSAPHTKEHKECESGCAGVFSAPVLIESLIQIFDQLDELDRLPSFMNRFGCEFYGVEWKRVPKQRFAKSKWYVPHMYGLVKPFLSGERLEWRID